jgi:hypothetical protein
LFWRRFQKEEKDVLEGKKSSDEEERKFKNLTFTSKNDLVDQVPTI